MTRKPAGQPLMTNYCRRCGRPAGVQSTFGQLCQSCYGQRHEIERLVRSYVAARVPGVSSSAPYDALIQYEDDALAEFHAT